MKAEDVNATLDLALQTSGLDQAEPGRSTAAAVQQRFGCVAGDLAKWLGARNIRYLKRRAPHHPMTPGEGARALAPDLQKSHSVK